MIAGDGRRRGACRAAGDARLQRGRIQPAEVRQRTRGGCGYTVDTARGERLPDQRSDPLRVDHVRGQEDLHVAGDVRQRLLAFAAQRCRRQRGELRERFGPQVQREQQVALRCRHRPRHAQALGARGEVLRLDALLVDLDLHVQRRLGACAGKRREQRRCDAFVVFVRDLAQGAVVVAQRLLLFAFQAAVDDQDDHDQQDHPDSKRNAPAHHHGVLVDRQPAARRLGTARLGPLRVARA